MTANFATLRRSRNAFSALRAIRPGAEAGTFVVLALLVIVGAVKSPLFLSTANLSNIGLLSVTLGLITIGETFVLLGGGIDMSVGSTVTLTAMIGAIWMNGSNAAAGWVLPILLALGCSIGLVNGIFVDVLRVEPFIVTFGMLFVLQGLAQQISLQPVGQTPPAMTNLYTATWEGVPVPVALMALVWVIASLVLRQSRFGWHVYAVGGRSEVARLNGIAVQRTRLATYVVSGAMAALAGMFTLVIQGLGNPTAGTNLEFLAITAAVLGGVSLAGGRGSLVGALGGVLILTTVTDLLQLLHVSSFYTQPLDGAIILLAVATRLRRPVFPSQRSSTNSLNEGR